MTKKIFTPLDDLELYELMIVAYPEGFTEESGDDKWDAVMDFVEEEFGNTEAVCDLLGRVVMLTQPMQSGLTGTLNHCLGKVEIKENHVQMIAAVSRPVEQEARNDG